MVNFYNFNAIEDEKLEFAVILSQYKDTYIFVKHKKRSTWEIPGGHRELEENISETAIRELKEETGAEIFQITPVCDYSVTSKDIIRYGRLFYSEVKVIGELPPYEIEKIDFFKKIPDKLTYPKIHPKLFEEILLRVKSNL